jgi:glycosyltransferase involved in cell wall biosynthesis
VTYIPNGVEAGEDADDEAASRLLQSIGLTSGGYWMFAAARVDPTKGCHTLIEAHASCGGATPLLVVGDLHHAPGYEESLRAGAGERVHFVPRLDDKPTLLGLLRQARLFVFPSTVEAMSMMLLEAVSLGVPTIASDIPENVGVLPRGYPTFRAGDAADLERAVGDLFARDPGELRSAAEAAREWVRERYRWEAIAAQYERIYATAARQTPQA